MSLALVLLVIGFAPLHEPAAPAPVVVIPSADHPCRLRIEVLTDGQASDADWSLYLERLHGWFDRDGDGSLSSAEARRVFPTPLPDKKHLAIDFPNLDADGDGKATVAELKTFFRTHGFGAVVLTVSGPAEDDLRLGSLLVNRLDANRDGRIEQPELKRAELLRKFDMNEDEYLDRAELLAGAPPASPSTAVSLKLESRGRADATLSVDLGDGGKPSRLDGDGVQLRDLRGMAGWDQLRGRDNTWLGQVQGTKLATNFRSASEFILAQFKTSLGSRTALTREELNADPTLSGLRELFPFAERDDDGRLSFEELKSYLELVQLGVRAQVWVKVTDLDQNPFAVLDADGDARLSAVELADARQALCQADDAAPRRYLGIAFTSPEVSHWGGIKLPAKPKPVPKAAAAKVEAPAWFKALDRNQDQVVSAREFLGPPEAFKKLDRDGNGLLTPDEVERP